MRAGEGGDAGAAGDPAALQEVVCRSVDECLSLATS